MKLPDFHDSYIIGLSIKNDDLTITLKLDYTIWNVKSKREIFTFYLQDCKNAKYWYNHLKKYDFDGVHYAGHHYSPLGIADIKLKRNEIVIYPCIDKKLTRKGNDMYKQLGLRANSSVIYGEVGKGRLPNPLQYKKNRVIRIKFKTVITS